MAKDNYDLFKSLLSRLSIVRVNASVPSMSITEVRAFNKIDVIETIFIKDAVRFGTFRYDSTDTTTTDDGAMTLVDARSRRYKRVDQTPRPKYFGAVGDGVTDDTTSLNAFLAYKNRGVIDFDPNAKYNVDGILLIEDKNGASGNPSIDTPDISSLVINGNGARIIRDGGVPTDILMKINRCKRLMINNLQVDGTVDVVGMWESGWKGFIVNILRFGTPNPATDFDQAYWNNFKLCTIGLLYIYTGTMGSKTEFNQNSFHICKIGYGISSNTLEPVRVYGTANAQSNTFTECDIIPPSNKTILYVDDTVNDVSFIFSGGTYIDTGIGMAADLKNVQIFHTGVVTNPAGAPLEYAKTKDASLTSITQISHPQIGSREAISSLNMMVNGNFRDAVTTTFAPTLSAGGFYGTILNLAAVVSGKEIYFESITLPFSGWYSIAVIGKLTAGDPIGSRWDKWNGSTWTELQYGVITISSADITWDSIAVYAEAGQKVRLLLYSGTAGATISLYSVALTWGVKAPLVPSRMHPEAGMDYTVTSSTASDTPWSETNPHGVTFEDGILKLFSANYNGVDGWEKGLIDDKYQSLKGIKEFVDGLFARKGTGYDAPANIGVEIGASNGDSVNDEKPYVYRWYVVGGANDGQYIKLQVKKAVYDGDDYDPDSEAWEDTGVFIDVNGDLNITDLILPSTGWITQGDPSTDGSWRHGRSGDDYVHQRRESGSWVTKQTITAV